MATTVNGWIWVGGLCAGQLGRFTPLCRDGAITEDGRLEIRPPPARPGDYLVLQAEMDMIVAFSACPMDTVATNGPDCIPKAAHYQILSGSAAV